MTAAAALLWLALLPQQPEAATPPPHADVLIERFTRLDAAGRTTVVRNMERHLQRLDDDLLQSVMAMERSLRSYPDRPEPVWLLPRDYAPLAAERHLIASGTPAHTRATARMRPLEFLPDLQAAVAFDWQSGKAVRLGPPLDDNQRFANYARGYAPGADHAIARLLEQMHQDPEQRLLGWYFGHLYADRDGGVYAGVTLFEAWNAGVVVEMPDTDAIAYARRVLQTESFTAPLPADRRRERLYRRVREGFAAHREYRSLRLAAAASFVAATPGFEATYEPLLRRCHWLWVQAGNDPKQFVSRMRQARDRADFLTEVDAQIRATPEVVAQRQQALGAIAEYIRALADRELQSLERR